MTSNTLRDIARMLDVGLEGLQTLQTFTHIGGPKADLALVAIDAGMSSLIDGFTGKTHPDVVAADLKSLVDKVRSSQSSLETGIENNNKTIDNAIDAKFTDGDTK